MRFFVVSVGFQANSGIRLNMKYRVRLSGFFSICYVGVLAMLSVNSSFRHEGDEICAVLGYYTARSGNSLPTFRHILLGLIGCTETLAKIYHYALRNNPEQRRSQTYT
jgi:hypothetical protein